MSTSCRVLDKKLEGLAARIHYPLLCYRVHPDDRHRNHLLLALTIPESSHDAHRHTMNDYTDSIKETCIF